MEEPDRTQKPPMHREHIAFRGTVLQIWPFSLENFCFFHNHKTSFAMAAAKEKRKLNEKAKRQVEECGRGTAIYPQIDTTLPDALLC